ncbi:MAG: HAD family hydrolase [Bacteroidales bacterium]
MRVQNINTILWDWNGTLLDDMGLCIESMNRLLKQRKLPLLCSDRYLQVFTFPVKDYYSKLGFDFTREPFEIPAEEFIVHYTAGISHVSLFDDAVSVLEYFEKKGYRQYIISAMEHNALIQSVKERNILHLFHKIAGINDNLAFGKTTIAQQLIIREKIDVSRCIFIGDTLHDAEVARDINVKSLLISRGHQHHERLKKTGNPVLNSLSDIISFLNTES